MEGERKGRGVKRQGDGKEGVKGSRFLLAPGLAEQTPGAAPAVHCIADDGPTINMATRKLGVDMPLAPFCRILHLPNCCSLTLFGHYITLL